jgi:nucleotide-binding universal stress UspA family protein
MPPTSNVNLSNLLVPVDGSASSGNAARFAAAIAEKMGGKLTLLHVYDATGLVMLGVASLTQAQLDEAKKNVSRETFESARNAIGAGAFDAAEKVTAIGEAAEEIIEHARKTKADLIVMGSRGRSAMKQLLLGSVSQKVVNHAPCGVTIVR